ncbi:MAG: hypothetical protein ACM3N5_12055 [Candidatus Eiseniibacteriota bacterium]
MSAASDPTPLDEVARFTARLRQRSWFAAVGQPANDAETATARDYLAGLGLSDLAIEWVSGWRAAEHATKASGSPADWWQAEEDERQALLRIVRRTMAEADYLAAMNSVVLEATEVVIGPAIAAASRQNVVDPALTKVAAGAATQACHHAALAIAAAAPDDHPFTLKFRLYAGGRWPLGAVGDTFYLF